MTNDTIVAPATAEGTAGLSVIRVSGGMSGELCKKLTKNKAVFIERTPVLSPVFFEDSIIDQTLITFFKEPRSYTGEDVYEISCHGNPVIVSSIINSLCEFGARISNPGEFTMRSFLNGKIDLVQAESVGSIIESKSILASIAHNKVLSGSLSKKLNGIKSSILLLISIVEFELDISEEDTSKKTISRVFKLIKNTCLECEKLLNNYKEGVFSFYSKIVICGEPNVGKSTLLNTLIGEERAIVSPVPGTTRDRIEVDLNIEQTRITLIDTAGLRETSDEVEKIGLIKTSEAMQGADILIHVVTSGSKKPVYHKKKINVLVFNKSDIYITPDVFKSAIKLSAKNHTGIKNLKRKLETLVNEKNKNLPDSFLATQRQFNHLQSCFKHLKRPSSAILKTKIFEPEIISIDLRSSLEEIDFLLGKTSFDDIFDNVFSNFCVGK